MIQETKWNGLEALAIKNKFCEGMMALHGGHVLSYRPLGEEKDLLWQSGYSCHEEGKPIRGGIPVCWPWFGPVPSPAHGLARLETWKLVSKEDTPAGTKIVMSFYKNDLQLTIEALFGMKLDLKLTTVNQGKADYRLTQALHTYFNVSDIMKTSVRGFEGALSEDRLTGIKTTPDEAITFGKETDLLIETESSAVIEDTGFARKILVEKSGSKSSVVWNPWIRKSKEMPDFGDEEYHMMVCVESVNAGNDFRILKPGESHTLSTTLSLLDK